MSETDWDITERLESAISSWLEAFASTQAKIDYAIYPSIMWTLGGSAQRGTEEPIEIPASYSAGFYRRDTLPEGNRIILLPSDRFGLVIFSPRPEDLASERRLIDFDGTDIVVR